MTDLDFDELDRAVSSLITNAPDMSDAPGEPEDKVLDIKSSLPANDQLPVTLSVNPVLPVDAPAPTAPRPTTGQFMDVVHPSSNMRRTPITMPERPVLRPVATIPTQVVKDTPSEPEVAPAASLPDPIDFHNANNPTPTVTEEAKAGEDDDIDKISDEITNELHQKLDETLDTPFIPGTKVEKRPLGAFSEDSEVKVDAPAETPPQVAEKPAEPKSESQKEAEASLPEELQDDLLHVESDDSPESDVNGLDKTKVDDTKLQTEAPTSISQQYKEQPSTGDQHSGAIYDTDAYHKGLIRPVKKKTGWLWVALIVLLLLAGIGVGVAAWVFKIL